MAAEAEDTLPDTGLSLDYGNFMAPRLPEGGVDPELLQGPMVRDFARAHATVQEARERGEMGFFQLPYQRESAAAVRDVADSFGQWFEDVLVLGIGGSTLGTLSVRDALLGRGWNELSLEERDHFPRLHVLENPDPAAVSQVLDRLDLRRTLCNVVSKSGSTAETMAQLLVVEGRLRELVGEEKARGHLLLTTDPERGDLRALAREKGIPALPVPPNVGGRFSVLSPVGLLPAAVTGVDVDGMLDGAARMEARCAVPELPKNPAGLLAVLLHHADRELNLPIHVLMPYTEGLRSFRLWFQQLWAESLGKLRRGDAGDEPVGPTPVGAVGPVDQHSLLQLLMEGPRDKATIFLGVREVDDPVLIPNLHGERGSMAYLGGHTLKALVDTERKATAEALRRAGRPNLTLEVERLDAPAMGGLFMLFQIATVYAGALYGVNPLDQPGVELGKELTYGLLGRQGFSAPDLLEPDPRWSV